MSNKLDKGNFSVRNIVSAFWSHKYVYIIILIFSAICIYIVTELLTQNSGQMIFRATVKDTKGNIFKSSITNNMHINFRSSNINNFKNCKLKDQYEFEQHINSIVSHEGFNFNIYLINFKNEKIIKECFKDVENFIKNYFKDLKKLIIYEDKYGLAKKKNLLDYLKKAGSTDPAYLSAYEKYMQAKEKLTESETLKLENLGSSIYIKRYILKKSDSLGMTLFLSFMIFIVFFVIKLFIQYLDELKKINK